MIDDLRFVQGAMKANKILPELEHYQLGGGRVIGYNGFMALSSPIALDIEAKPKADLFNKAIQACGDTIAINLTDSGNLRIASGPFTATIKCTTQEVYNITLEGEMFEAPPNLTETFKRLLPFISEDASRPWAMGLGVHNGCFEATNNIIIHQVWTGHNLPSFNCPRFAVAEIVRLKVNPSHVQVNPNAVTFHWADTGRWLRTNLLTDEWPHAIIEQILAGDGEADPQPVPDGLFEAVETLRPFASPNNQAVRIGDGFVSTGEGDSVATIMVPGLTAGPVFSISILALLAGHITGIDFGAYPKPCPFIGPNSRGIILGQRA